MPDINFNSDKEDVVDVEQTPENIEPTGSESEYFDEEGNAESVDYTELGEQDDNELYDTPEIPIDNKPSEEQGQEPYYIKDPNSIQVQFGKGPFVILFGPPSCGKTMTLIRLSRYLKEEQGFKMTANKDFRNSQDKKYEQLCEDFPDYLNHPKGLAAGGTNLLDFILVNANDRGSTKFKILEAPGEHYFDPTNPNKQSEFPPYIRKLINNSKETKIWVIVLEPNWSTEETRSAYVDSIKSLLKQQTNAKGRKVVILYNKVDKTELETHPGFVNRRQLMTDIDTQYPGLRKAFKNEIPIVQLFKPYSCEFVPFSTGNYIKSDSGLVYEQSSDIYPKQLWSVLKRLIGIR